MIIPRFMRASDFILQDEDDVFSIIKLCFFHENSMTHYSQVRNYL